MGVANCCLFVFNVCSASKDFFDPVGAGRRIYYGWALVPPASTQVHSGERCAAVALPR
jgi:hypothetical protein